MPRVHTRAERVGNREELTTDTSVTLEDIIGSRTPTPRHTEHTRCSPTCDLAGMCVDCGQPWPCATESVRRQSYAPR
jgi:hypothetical protein